MGRISFAWATAIVSFAFSNIEKTGFEILLSDSTSGR
jgi:hypothetical protein